MKGIQSDVMRVIIAGSREFNDYELLKQKWINIFWQLNKEGYNTKRDNDECNVWTYRWTRMFKAYYKFCNRVIF